MLSNITTLDLVLCVFVAFGMLQLAWFSVMILRRGAPPITIQHALPPLLTIWVLMWPLYIDTGWLWISLITILIPILLARLLNTPFWQHLRIAWGKQDSSRPTLNLRKSLPLLPLTHFIVAIGIAAAWFQSIPEFGFGLALCLCLAFPAAYWVDQLGIKKYAFRQLGFPAHPKQTLAGHLILILTSTILLCWSLHVYHGTEWQSLFIATLIVGMVASATRAIIPGQWNVPAAMLSMGAVMWLL